MGSKEDGSKPIKVLANKVYRTKLYGDGDVKADAARNGSGERSKDGRHRFEQ